MARRAVAVVLGLVWVAMSYPLFPAFFRERFLRSGGLVFLGLLALFAALPPVARWIGRGLLWPRTPVFVAALALAAAGISLGVVVGILQGRVLSLDSSVYLFEARALAHLHFGTPVPSPVLASSARFLFEGQEGVLYGVFPPGFPLFVAPFLWVGVPLLAGPVIAAVLAVGQYLLARAVSRDEWAARCSMLLGLPSYARAIETADLLSHGFVAALSAWAIALAFDLEDRPSRLTPILVGAAAGWVFSARLLDGLVLGVFAAAIVARAALRPGGDRRWMALLVAGALPFVMVLMAEQRAATGSASLPTQSEYFVRSDYPPTCHRLGFGKDVGCSVEHPSERASFGPDGYGLDDALRVGSERATVLGRDLFGFAPLAFLGLITVVASPAGRPLIVAGFWVLFAAGYLLFYYGNAPAYGARHLFPVAPFIYALVARQLSLLPHREKGWFDRWHVLGGALGAVVLIGGVLQGERWRQSLTSMRTNQLSRVDLRAESDRRPGIAVAQDTYGFISTIDPPADRPGHVIALDDRAALVELRRTHPDLPLWRAERRALGDLLAPRPLSPGFSVELETAWPSFQRPEGLGAKRIFPRKVFELEASGDEALGIFRSSLGATLRVPFETRDHGPFTITLVGFAGPEMGRYEVSIDGARVGSWEGFAPTRARIELTSHDPLALAPGRHELLLRCTGKDPASRDYLGAFDQLRGRPPGPPGGEPSP
jgi:hypothetical protein